MKPRNNPRVPGDSTRDGDDGKQVPCGVRGEKNLRVSVNHQTTNAMQMDLENTTELVNDDYVNQTSNRSSQTKRYNLRSATQIGTLSRHIHVEPLSPSSTQSLFNSPSSSPQSFQIEPHSYRSSPVAESIGSEDVVQEASALDPAPTNDNKRARKKWTNEMNEFITRTYFIITENETKPRAYLDRLHQQFTQQFPQMDVSKQRVGDQRRAILRNKLIADNRLNEIKQDALQELTQNKDKPNQDKNVGSQANLQHITTQTRMKWTDEINEEIMKAYYRITQIEQNKTAYRKQLHTSFVSQFPDLSHVSEQRIADQRRVIVHNKLITSQRLQEIRQEIQQELHMIHTQHTNEINTEDGRSNIDSQIDDVFTNGSLSNTNTQDGTDTNIHQIFQNSDSELDSKINEIFDTTYEKYKHTNPTTRPYIPRQNTSRKLAYIVKYLDSQILPNYLYTYNDFITNQTVIYCAAFTAAVCNGCKIRDKTETVQERQKITPAWQKRLQNKIENIRKDIGRMTQYIAGIRSRSLIQNIYHIKNKYKTHSRYEEPNLTDSQFLDSLKQRLNAASSRLRRYTKCTLRKQQNTQFDKNEKQFYRHINTQTQDTARTVNELMPTTENMHSFWSQIWENEVRHNENAEWIHADSQQVHCDQMQYEDIPVDLFVDVIKSTHNWKAPGTDNIHNYWYKKFTTAYPVLYNHINEFIKSPDTMPHYISQGITHMIAKDNDLSNPAKYRPITCLQTIYKIITSCISRLVSKHLTHNGLLAEEQKGCRKFSQGCKEQLLIDSVAMKQALKNKTNLHTMYIDYRKAYDSVPHSWLIHVLHLYKIHPSIISFLEVTMQHWKTKLSIKNKNENIETDEISIKRGIFQGDAFSPLWFCLGLNPLSRLLNDSGSGLHINNDNDNTQTLTHLMYMDDIKLYSHNTQTLHQLADITQTFSNDINMQFGIDKCKTFSIQDQAVVLEPYTLSTGEIVEPLDENTYYKYLGFQQAHQISHNHTKSEVTRKFRHRLNTILKSQLNSRNIVKAINTYAIPILTYTFGIIKWSQTDLIKLQRTINTTMTAHRKHHPRSCIQRLTLPRSEGGRGIIDIVNLHNKQISTLRNFFHDRAETSSLHQAIVQNDKKHTPLNLKNHNPQRNETITDAKDKVATWKQKSLHGRHYQDLQQPHVDKTASNAWLQRGELFPETEAFMLAIQDQVIDTRNYQKHIIRNPNIADTCRRCCSSSETIQHITGACKAIVQTDYKHRHDQVAAIIHQYLAHKYKLIDEKVPYYKYTPQSVLENSNYRLYWDRTIITDKTVHFNRPDVTVLDKNNKTAYLIDIAICNTHNLQTTHTEKIAKYTDLSIEIKTQWQINSTRTIPIVLSTTGVIPKTLHTSLETLNIPGTAYKLLQKAAILNTCRIVRKFLSLE